MPLGYRQYDLPLVCWADSLVTVAMMWIAYALLLMSVFLAGLFVLARYEPVWSGLQDTTEYRKNLMGVLAVVYLVASVVAAGTAALSDERSATSICAEP